MEASIAVEIALIHQNTEKENEENTSDHRRRQPNNTIDCQINLTELSATDREQNMSRNGVLPPPHSPYLKEQSESTHMAEQTEHNALFYLGTT